MNCLNTEKQLKLKNVQDKYKKTESPSAFVALLVVDKGLIAVAVSALSEKSLERRNSVIFICSWAAISNSIIGLF